MRYAILTVFLRSDLNRYFEVGNKVMGIVLLCTRDSPAGKAKWEGQQQTMSTEFKAILGGCYLKSVTSLNIRGRFVPSFTSGFGKAALCI